jgi:nucleoside-diphosphate kinase
MKKEPPPQRLFFMIKPDGMSLEATIREKIAPAVDIVASRLFDPIDVERIEELYIVHKDKFFYPRLIDYFKGNPVKTFLLSEREGANYKNGFIGDFLELVGDTDPAKAAPGTIRSMSSDSLERSISEKRALRNLVHRSTTCEETDKEAPIFFWDYILDRSKVKGEQGEMGRYLARKGKGIFYEERIESSLKEYKLLSFDEELICYQDLGGRQEGTHSVKKATVKALKNGSVSERELTLPPTMEAGA